MERSSTFLLVWPLNIFLLSLTMITLKKSFSIFGFSNLCEIGPELHFLSQNIESFGNLIKVTNIFKHSFL